VLDKVQLCVLVAALVINVSHRLVRHSTCSECLLPVSLVLLLLLLPLQAPSLASPSPHMTWQNLTQSWRSEGPALPPPHQQHRLRPQPQPQPQLREGQQPGQQSGQQPPESSGQDDSNLEQSARGTDCCAGRPAPDSDRSQCWQRATGGG